MTAKKKTLPKFSAVSRDVYDASRDKPRSGKHKGSSMALRAPATELEAATAAAERLGVTRNDLARAALRVASREKMQPVVARAFFDELQDLGAITEK